MKKLTLLLSLSLLIALLGTLPLLRRHRVASVPGPSSVPAVREKPVGLATPAAAAALPDPANGEPSPSTNTVGASSTFGSSYPDHSRRSSPAQSPGPTSADGTPGTAPALTPDELAERFASASTAADLLQAADLTDPAQRAYVVARMSEMAEIQRDNAYAAAERHGIPMRIEGPGNKVSILHDFRDGRPLYRTTHNANAAISTGADVLRDQPAPYGLRGSGLTVGVWDEAKVRTTHQEFSGGRVTIKDFASTFSDHATHVAGTIGATGVVAAAKGMAPQVRIDSYDWNNDYSEMVAAGAATATDNTRLFLSNHSYGYDAATSDMGRYENEARLTDSLTAALPYYLVFQSAGNEQDELTALNGYQSITFTGLAKNVLTIAAGNDAVSSGQRAPSAGTLASFSSLGPCDDGRIKPDLTANGVNLYSSISSGDAAYDGTYSGTSMSSPNAAGSAALVQELYSREFSGQRLRASALKALLIHTADDVGRPGPDYQYGWGYLNVRAAADLVLAHKASTSSPKIIESTLSNSTKTRTHVFAWDGVSAIRATLCWTDPAGAFQSAPDSRTPNLVHDLDLKLTAPDGSPVTLPFVMPFVGTWTLASMSQNATTGANHVDNVEQVLLSAPPKAGSYTLTVSLTGSLTTETQTYSLIVSGGASVASNPAPVVTLDSPAHGTTVSAGTSVALSATASDKVVGGAPGVVSKVEFIAGAASIGVVSTPPYALAWTPPGPGIYSITASATDSEGAVAVSSAATITVLSGDGTPAISGLSPTSGGVGDIVTITGTNFIQVSSVRFNGVSAAFTVDSTTSLRATVPAAAATGVVTVTTPYGTTTSAGVFTVVRNPVLISQLYGGGGLSGASYNADYVELHNRSDAAVNLDGWSVQYASGSGTSWQAVPLAGTLQPGTYYLVQLAGGATGATPPTPDASGAANLGSTLGKVALRNTTAAFTGSSPLGQGGLQDFVGYGLANASEGSPAPAPSVTTALYRAGIGTIDTGNNSADFSTGAPNPRNTLAGPIASPVITGATSATAEIDKTFSYQIVASNAPTAYGASGLPLGLQVNTATGLLSGTPGSTGTYVVTLSATNVTGTGTATLTIVVAASDIVLFSENMGSPSGTIAVADHTFQNTGLVFSGTADVRTTNASSGYTNASGSGNIFFTGIAGRSFEISGIDTTGYVNLALRFGHFKNSNVSSNELTVAVSADGLSYTTLNYARVSGTGTANTWALVKPTGSVPATPNLRIRFTQTTNVQFRIDDLAILGRLPLQTFSAWADGLSDPAPAADPDGDGAANLLEYFMALDPEVAEDGRPRVSASAGVLRLDYRRSKTLDGAFGVVEWTTNLSGTPLWTTAGVTDILVADEGTHELRRASVSLSTGETTKFLRLRVTLPQP